MVFYVPREWLLNKDNELAVQDILEQYLYRDMYNDTDASMNTDREAAMRELEQLGEMTVIEMLKNEAITID